MKHCCPHCDQPIGRRSSVHRHIKKGRCRAFAGQQELGEQGQEVYKEFKVQEQDQELFKVQEQSEFSEELGAPLPPLVLPLPPLSSVS